MSGGHFDYRQRWLDDFVEGIEKLIATNNSCDTGEGYIRDEPRNYSSSTIESFKQGINAVKIAKIFVDNIDLLVCGDNGEDSYHEQICQELREIG